MVAKLVLMDVYETLLDMSDIQRKVNALMDNKYGYALWFEMFMQYCFEANSTGRFRDFSEIGGATMKMTGKIFGENISDHDISQIFDLLKHVPLREGVQEGLSELYDMNIRIVALTNSSERIVTERMTRTGLISYFEHVFSAEQAGKYKPATDVYLWAAGKLKLNPGEMLMVSSHSWDIDGAASAGLKTAWLRQPRQLFYPLANQPDLMCDSLPELAAHLRQETR